MDTTTPDTGPIRRQRHGIEAVTTYVTLARADRERAEAVAAARRTSLSSVIGEIVAAHFRALAPTTSDIALAANGGHADTHSTPGGPPADQFTEEGDGHHAHPQLPGRLRQPQPASRQPGGRDADDAARTGAG